MKKCNESKPNMTKNKIQSLVGKGKTLASDGLDPLMAGMEAYNNEDPETEALAKTRSETCSTCEHFEDEPVQSLQIQDQRIPELSKKMCGDCFCALPYKTRQSVKPCDKWQA